MAVNDGQHDRRPNLSGGSDAWDVEQASVILLEDYFPTGESPPESVTGTIAVTEANDTSSATGTVTVTGTIAVTEANDTSSATGTVTVTGTIAATEANDTSNATGTVEGAEPEPPVEPPTDTPAPSGGFRTSPWLSFPQQDAADNRQSDDDDVLVLLAL
jgi:hypothetical protein